MNRLSPRIALCCPIAALALVQVSAIAELSPKPEPTERPAALASAQELSRLFRQVAAKVGPGVVHIKVEGGTLSAEQRKELTDEYRKRNPFDVHGQFALETQLARYQLPPGTGSGLVYSKDGLILTCRHVIDQRTSITVLLPDRRTLKAQLLASDPPTDLAVLKIAAEGLTPLTFAQSESVHVGDWVLTVGAPFGLTQTVTHGIVSAVAREEVEGVSTPYQRFIQTDAAVHPGNSGGPLVNLHGEVIGITSASAPLSEAMTAGIGFAIPSDLVVRTVRPLLEQGTALRPWLGIEMAELTKGDAEVFQLREGGGVLVVAVILGTSAAEAGLQPEDIIVAVDEAPIASVNQLQNRIAEKNAGATVLLEIVRNRRRVALRAKVQKRPKSVKGMGVWPGWKVERLGVLVRTGREGMKSVRKFFYPPGGGVETRDEAVRGVIVLAVAEDVKGTISPGDWIMECNGKRTRSVYDLKQAVAGLTPGQTVRLKLDRRAGGKQEEIEMNVRPPDNAPKKTKPETPPKQPPEQPK